VCRETFQVREQIITNGAEAIEAGFKVNCNVYQSRYRGETKERARSSLVSCVCDSIVD
jgi:hypothetical protein